MPSMRFFNDLVTATQIDNVLAGSPFEFVGRDSQIVIAAATEAVALGGDMEVFFGSDLVFERGRLPAEAVAMAGPVIPENIMVSGVAIAGDRLTVRVFNNAAANLEITVMIQIVSV